MYGLRTRGTIRAAAPDRFRNDGNAESRAMHAASAAAAFRRRPGARRHPSPRAHVSGCKGLFPCDDHWHRAWVRVKYRAFWEGVDARAASGRIASQSGYGRDSTGRASRMQARSWIERLNGAGAGNLSVAQP